MHSEAGSVIFYDQTFGGSALPESGDTTSEEARLRAASIGVYELSFRQQPSYELGGAFLFNDEQPHSQSDDQKQFEILEDIAGIERTLMIQSVGDAINLESVEIIPLDWRQNPVEFTQMAVSESQRTIRYRKEPPPESLKLKLSGVNVFDIEIVSASLSANGRDFFPGNLAAFIRRTEDIRIDRLDNPQGSTRRIEEHLLTFFGLLLEKAPDRTFDFECSYRYPVVEGGPDVLVPVVLRRSLTLPSASESFSNLLPQLNAWYQNFMPPEGVFDFGVKVYGAGSRESVPIIQFTGLVLPIKSIAGWNNAHVN